MQTSEPRPEKSPKAQTPSDLHVGNDTPDASSEQAPREATLPWHATPVESVQSHWNVGAKGLSSDEVAERRARFGSNSYEIENTNTFLRRLLAQVNNLLIYVLLVAALVTLLTGHELDAVVILAVVVLNVVIGLYQEGKAEKSLLAIKKMLAPKAQTLRDGRLVTLDAEELVPGDTLIVASGDNLPADVRFISTVNLHVDESALTGESVPVSKQSAPVAEDATLGDQFSMGFSGTLVTQGSARGIVVRTGMQTEMGRIGRMLKDVQSTKTPLVESMEGFSRWLTLAILGFAVALFAYGHWLMSLPMAEAFMAVVGLAVAAIPEGLPAILTITMAIGVQRMAKRRAVIRRLPAVETLGSVTVICSDKTGTLTRNEMTVQSIVVGSQQIEISGSGYIPEGDLIHDGKPYALQAINAASLRQGASPLALIGITSALCNEASLSHESDGQWSLTGDPTEGALLTLAMKLGIDIKALPDEMPRRAHIPFESEHRFMATVHREHHDALEVSAALLVKGAPEKLLSLSTSQFDSAGQARELDLDYWQEKIEQQASQGRRVLGFAIRHGLTDTHQDNISSHAQNLTFIGIVGIMDPPRDEAIEAIEKCHNAGIRVKMITGDHASTALAISKELHIGQGTKVMTGVELETMTDVQLQQAVRDIDVFARASPEHKIRLVKALQANLEVVAMTGDGVNDAPALKQADIGIAMGQKGTEAAKQAAAIVLTDDNFASIVNAVEEGRTIYDNLKKTISFLLPINGGESMAIGFAILIGAALPITPLQILWINMVSSIGLAMVLAFEPAEPGIMNRKPRSRHDALLSPFLIWRIAFVSSLFLMGIFGLYHWAISQGESVETARTVAMNALVCMEVFYLFSVRYMKAPSFTWIGIRGTPRVLLSITIVVGLQIIMTYTPFMQTWFSTTALSIEHLSMVVAAGVILLVMLETEKAISRKIFA